MLTITPPILKQSGTVGAQFVSEKPIHMECASVAFPDAAPVKLEQVAHAGFIMRRHPKGGRLETWDEGEKRWLSCSPLIEPQPLFYKDNAWHALIVAVGQKDRNNEDKFATDRSTGFPRYSVQCVFKARDDRNQEHSGISAESTPIQISALGGQNRAGLYLRPQMDPTSATEIGLFLKDTAFSNERRIAIREGVGGFRIELISSGSSIEILPTGEILLTPGSGQNVHIAGNLRVNGNVTAASYL